MKQKGRTTNAGAIRRAFLSNKSFPSLCCREEVARAILIASNLFYSSFNEWDAFP